MSNGKISPFVLSVDGMLRKEALSILTKLSQLIAIKIEEPLSQVRGWVNGQTAIVVTRLYSRMIRRARLPISLWDQEPDQDPGSGLGLAQ